MKVIAALGNPGNQYNFTRHNFGFLVLDFYAKLNGFEWKDEKKFNIKYFKDGDKLFIKPLTFYNDVGQSFESLRSYYKLTPQDFLIVCDDFNLEFGKLRYRERGSAAAIMDSSQPLPIFTPTIFRASVSGAPTTIYANVSAIPILCFLNSLIPNAVSCRQSLKPLATFLKNTNF